MARDHYARANRQFDSYFAGTSEASVHPDAYRWVFQMSAAQGDFSRARHFLDLYSKSVRLTEEQKLQLAALKKSYEQGQRLLDEKELERAFHEGGDESGFDGEPARNPRGR
jgi:hypothetical protein